MRTRGRPRGSSLRTSINGRNIRPRITKRGAKSVIRTPLPWRSHNVVSSTAVLRR